MLLNVSLTPTSREGGKERGREGEQNFQLPMSVSTNWVCGIIVARLYKGHRSFPVGTEFGCCSLIQMQLILLARRTHSQEVIMLMNRVVRELVKAINRLPYVIKKKNPALLPWPYTLQCIILYTS